MTGSAKPVAGSLPADFDPVVVGEIRTRLDHVRDEGLKVLFAIESGSRAWGFPSPDSDYDCRFVYLCPPGDHFVLEQRRDVIEFPIEGDFDTGGWDLRKALRLALKGNAAILEWTVSPIVYEEIPGFRASLLDLLGEILDPAKVAHHYLGLLRTQAGRHDMESGEAPIKKAFYAIRPLVALEWMAERDFRTLPPMNMPDCLAGTAIAGDVRDAIWYLVEQKSRTRELGTGRLPAPLARFIRDGMHAMAGRLPRVSRVSGGLDERRIRADLFYSDLLKREAGLAPADAV